MVRPARRYVRGARGPRPKHPVWGGPRRSRCSRARSRVDEQEFSLSRNREKQGESVTSIDQNRPNILLGSESFALDRGGVSRVGRLVSHVLTDARKDYSLLSLNESKIESELGKSLLACAGSRLRFAAALWQPNDRYTHFMYTHLGIARAHCNLARLRRPTPFGFTESKFGTMCVPIIFARRTTPTRSSPRRISRGLAPR